jgi:hypothetical protein
MRTGGIAKRRRKLEEGETIAEAVRKGRKLTSGFMVSNGCHSLNCIDVVNSVRHVVEQKKSDITMKERKNRMELRQKAAAVSTLDVKNMANWNARECRTYLQWKKKNDDSAMPNTIGALRTRCKEWSSRPSPNVSPHSSDDEIDLQEGDDIKMGTV